jgi:hypothetical protein
MKKLFFSILLPSIVYCGFSQDSIPRLSFEFGYSYHTYAMDTLNDKLIEPAMNTSVKFLDEKLVSGHGFNFNIGYQVSESFQFGFHGDFQRGSSEYNPMFPMGSQPPIEGFYSIRTENLNAGIHLTYWFSALFDKTSRVSSKRLKYGVATNLGIGRGSYEIFIFAPIDQYSESYHRIFSANAFHGQFELKTEYQIMKKSLFSSIGIRVGYQYFRTNYLRTRAEEYNLVASYPDSKLQLDFSGFYYGIYLKLAR